MPSAAAISLPDDMEILKQMVQHLLSDMSAKDREILNLKCQLEALRRRIFGRKSEKIDPNQLALFEDLTRQLEEAEARQAVEESAAPVEKPNSRAKRRTATAVGNCRRTCPWSGSRSRCPSRTAPALRPGHGADRRGNHQRTGVRAGVVHHPAVRPIQVRVQAVCRGRGDRGAAGPADSQGHPGTRAAGPGADQQVRRPSAAEPPAGDLPAAPRRSVDLDAVRLGAGHGRSAHAPWCWRSSGRSCRRT